PPAHHRGRQPPPRGTGAPDAVRRPVGPGRRVVRSPGSSWGREHRGSRRVCHPGRDLLRDLRDPAGPGPAKGEGMTSVEDGAHDYDLIVIGGGPTGENVADYAAKR